MPFSGSEHDRDLTVLPTYQIIIMTNCSNNTSGRLLPTTFYNLYKRLEFLYIKLCAIMAHKWA